MRCTLSFTCTHRKHTGFCCYTCGNRDTCDDACQNHPDRCMVSRESTARETVFDYNMQRIELRGEYNKILETGEPVGLFYFANTFESQGIDNRTGIPVVSEKFATSEESIRWLKERVEADRERDEIC